VDEAKKASIAKMLADNVVVTAPGEKLDEKLARLTFPIEASDDRACFATRPVQYLTRCLVPPPSSEENAWWNKPGGHDPIGPFCSPYG
jgi:hypothetical protein